MGFETENGEGCVVEGTNMSEKLVDSLLNGDTGFDEDDSSKNNVKNGEDDRDRSRSADRRSLSLSPHRRRGRSRSPGRYRRDRGVPDDDSVKPRDDASRDSADKNIHEDRRSDSRSERIDDDSHRSNKKAYEKRDGDWVCPVCNADCFKDRLFCYKCRSPKPGTGNSMGGMRPGDWLCIQCGGVNFAKRAICYKCGSYRPHPSMYTMGMHSHGPTYGGYGMRFPNASHMGHNQQGGGERQWNCVKCREVIPEHRTDCTRCGSPRPSLPNSNFQGPNDPRYGQNTSYVSPRNANNMNPRMRPGDWMCPSCNQHNYASRNQCHRCKIYKPANIGIFGRDVIPGNVPQLRGEGMVNPMQFPSGNYNQGNKASRAGDWICGKCSSNCFGSRDTCFKCGASRAEGKLINPDDWVCPSCKSNVFGFKSECYKCRTPKP